MATDKRLDQVSQLTDFDYALLVKGDQVGKMTKQQVAETIGNLLYGATTKENLASVVAGVINPFVLKQSPGASDDINSLIDNGIYPIRANSLQNTPINDLGILIVTKVSDTSLTQILIASSNYRIYVRYMSGGTWYEWKHVKLTD